MSYHISHFLFLLLFLFHPCFSIQGKGCGGGGLRILPHKSWNVYNYENKQKVKADEEKYNKEVKEKEKKKVKEDSAFRLDVLRKRAKRKRGEDADDMEALNASLEEPKMPSK